MTRIMGDATHANAATLAAALPPVDLVAGYVTGTPDIQWTAADWAMFPGKTLVTIDQGDAGSPVASATVRDVEPGAWTPLSAVMDKPWTAARPTIYCDQNDLTRPGGVLSCGWQGDLWLAISGWQPGDPLPAAPGCTIVAVQDHYETAFDLSYVLDPGWPAIGGSVNGTGSIIVWGQLRAYLLNGGRAHPIGGNDELAMYTAAGVPVAGSPGGGVGQGSRLTAAEEAQFLADFPPGNPAVTVNTTGPAYQITGTATPA